MACALRSNDVMKLYPIFLKMKIFVVCFGLSLILSQCAQLSPLDFIPGASNFENSGYDTAYDEDGIPLEDNSEDAWVDDFENASGAPAMGGSDLSSGQGAVESEEVIPVTTEEETDPEIENTVIGAPKIYQPNGATSSDDQVEDTLDDILTADGSVRSPFGPAKECDDEATQTATTYLMMISSADMQTTDEKGDVQLVSMNYSGKTSKSAQRSLRKPNGHFKRSDVQIDLDIKTYALHERDSDEEITDPEICLIPEESEALRFVLGRVDVDLISNHPVVERRALSPTIKINLPDALDMYAKVNLTSRDDRVRVLTKNWAIEKADNLVYVASMESAVTANTSSVISTEFSVVSDQFDVASERESTSHGLTKHSVERAFVPHMNPNSLSRKTAVFKGVTLSKVKVSKTR